MSARGRGGFKPRPIVSLPPKSPKAVEEEEDLQPVDKNVQEKAVGDKEVGHEFATALTTGPVGFTTAGSRGRGGRGGRTGAKMNENPPTTEQSAEETNQQERDSYTTRGTREGGPRGRGNAGRGGGRGGRGGATTGTAGTSSDSQEQSSGEAGGSKTTAWRRREASSGGRGHGTGGNNIPVGSGSPERRGGQGVAKEDLECHYCHELGHFVKECPNKPEKRPTFCFECNQEGHLARYCPDKTDRTAPILSRGDKNSQYIPPKREIDEIFYEDEEVRNSYTQIAEQDDELQVLNANGRPGGTVAKIDTWADAHLVEALADNISRAGYTIPRKIQAFTIPIIMEGGDLIAQAETGSGKSAAFLIPIIHQTHPKVSGKEQIERDHPFAIIIEPTRELVFQVYEQARKLANKTAVRVVKAYGEYSFSVNSQEIFEGCDLVVATPGRLMHFLSSNVLSTGLLEYLVLDEGDRLLDEKFGSDTNKIIEFIRKSKKAPDNLQVLLFSATFPDRLEAFGRNVLREDHLVVRNNRHSLPNNRITQTFESSEGEDKKIRMYQHCRQILDDYDSKEKAERQANPPPPTEDDKKKTAEEEEERDSSFDSNKENQPGTSKVEEAKKKRILDRPRILIFCNAKSKADAFAFYLSSMKIPALSLNSDRPQRWRERTLSQFREGSVSVVVATDVCARGLDIKELDYVVNFDMPASITSYIQRIGRTGRLRPGFAHSFFDPVGDKALARDLIKLLQSDNITVPSFIVECLQSTVQPVATIQQVPNLRNVSADELWVFSPTKEPAPTFEPTPVPVQAPSFSSDEDEAEASGFDFA